MAYTKKVWAVNDTVTSTLLNNVENGLETAASTADTASSTITAHAAAANPHSGSAPTSHTHAASDVNSGTLAIARIPTGTTGTTVPFGNDSRFTDARTPTAHSHAAADTNSGTFAYARISLKFPAEERQASDGTWPSTDVEATRHVEWIGYPGRTDPPAATGRPASVPIIDSYTLRT